jgi:hypothetical protein
MPFPPPNQGDNLDALDVGLFLAGPPTTIFFSMDAPWPDPLTGWPLSGGALANGFSAADVMWIPFVGAPPAVFAPAPMLGLDLIGGPQSDDLDALILWENGSQVFEPAPAPYTWFPMPGAAPTDMLLFSVRRGSAVIGAPDSMFGIPIEEGDILSTPFAGGVSPYPSLWMAAENLGLNTVRSGAPPPFGDELDALDVFGGVFPDCNQNNVPDPIDIASGVSIDCNLNFIPDECEYIGVNYCGPAAVNSAGVSGFIQAAGVAVPGAPLALYAKMLPQNQFGYFLTSLTQGFFQPPNSQGFVCLGGSIGRFNTQVQNTGLAGMFCIPVNTLFMPVNPPVPVMVGQAWNFQCWYRDVGNTNNFTDGIRVQF